MINSNSSDLDEPIAGKRVITDRKALRCCELGKVGDIFNHALAISAVEDAVTRLENVAETNFLTVLDPETGNYTLDVDAAATLTIAGVVWVQDFAESVLDKIQSIAFTPSVLWEEVVHGFVQLAAGPGQEPKLEYQINSFVESNAQYIWQMIAFHTKPRTVGETVETAQTTQLQVTPGNLQIWNPYAFFEGGNPPQAMIQQITEPMKNRLDEHVSNLFDCGACIRDFRLFGHNPRHGQRRIKL